MARSAPRWIRVRPWPCPTVTAVLALVAVGCLWGGLIGLVVGCSVGGAFVLIGIASGTAIGVAIGVVGAAIGVIVAVVASSALAALLLVGDQAVTDPRRLAADVAGGLATLVGVLATLVLAATVIMTAGNGHWSGLRDAVVTTGAVLLASAGTMWLLRFASRHLTRVWARASGWQEAR